MNFALCDDNPAFLQLLRQRLMDECAKKDWDCRTTLFTNEKDLLRANLSAVQVIFLDIDMPEMNGLEVARRLRAKYAEVLIVFVTGFPKFAPAGYTVNAFRFLVKTELDENLSKYLEDIWNQLFIKQESACFRSVDGPVRVRLEDILYIKGTDKRHVFFYLAGTAPETLECIGCLKEYEARLAGKTFLHIKKGCFVNMYHVLDIRGYMALLDNGERLAVSRKDYARVRSEYVLWKGQS